MNANELKQQHFRCTHWGLCFCSRYVYCPFSSGSSPSSSLLLHLSFQVTSVSSPFSLLISLKVTGEGEENWHSIRVTERRSVLRVRWRTDAEAETPILWPPDEKRGLIGKDPDAGKDWGQEEKGTTEEKMVGWHYQLYRHEVKQTLGDDEGRRIWCATVHGASKCRVRLNDWATKCYRTLQLRTYS